MLYQRYDLVARAKAKQILGSVGVCERTPTRSVVRDSRATLRGPTPPPMAASGLVRFGSRARTEWARKCEKIVKFTFVWLLGGSHTVAICRNFEFFRPGRPDSEAQQLKSCPEGQHSGRSVWSKFHSNPWRHTKVTVN